MNEFYIFEDIEYHEKIPVKHFIAAIEESWGTGTIRLKFYSYCRGRFR